jgi:hypothetical protein
MGMGRSSVTEVGNWVATTIVAWREGVLVDARADRLRPSEAF